MKSKEHIEIKTGNEEIEDIFFSGLGRRLVLLGGRNSRENSFFLYGLANNVYKNNPEAKVHFFTLEPEVEMMFDCISCISEDPAIDKDTVLAWRGYAFTTDDGYNYDENPNIIEHIFLYEGGGIGFPKIDLIMIDSLDLLGIERKGEFKELLWDILFNLRVLSRKLNATIVVNSSFEFLEQESVKVMSDIVACLHSSKEPTEEELGEFEFMIFKDSIHSDLRSIKLQYQNVVRERRDDTLAE